MKTEGSSTSRTNDLRKSWALYDHVSKYLGCGSSTLSKAAKNRVDEPPVIERGAGCRIWDLDGNEYIDFANALGPITLGHSIPEINRAIAEQLENGIIFSRPHRLEGEVAEILCDIIPSAERVRFLKTGGEAIAACIKIARNATGRSRIIQCGYNGWLNTLSSPAGFVPSGISSSAPTRGVPSETSSLHMSLPWAQLDAWERAFSEHGAEIAAVVIAANYDEMDKGFEFLPMVRRLCDQYGALLVFDEIVTGFRLARAGAQEYFNVTPDLSVFAKGMANGMPISAYLGKAELIESCSEIGISSTFGGETLSLAAVKAVQRFYDENDVIAYLWSAARAIWDEGVAILRSTGLPIELNGVPVCPRFSFGDGVSSGDFFAAAYRNGLLLYDVPYTSFSHKTDDISQTHERLNTMVREL